MHVNVVILPATTDPRPLVPDYLRIRKSKRPASKLEEDPPPALVKRPKTTSS